MATVLETQVSAQKTDQKTDQTKEMTQTWNEKYRELAKRDNGYGNGYAKWFTKDPEYTLFAQKENFKDDLSSFDLVDGKMSSTFCFDKRCLYVDFDPQRVGHILHYMELDHLGNSDMIETIEWFGQHFTIKMLEATYTMQTGRTDRYVFPSSYQLPSMGGFNLLGLNKEHLRMTVHLKKDRNISNAQVEILTRGYKVEVKEQMNNTKTYMETSLHRYIAPIILDARNGNGDYTTNVQNLGQVREFFIYGEYYAPNDCYQTVLEYFFDGLVIETKPKGSKDEEYKVIADHSSWMACKRQYEILGRHVPNHIANIAYFVTLPNRETYVSGSLKLASVDTRITIKTKKTHNPIRVIIHPVIYDFAIQENGELRYYSDLARVGYTI